MTKKWDSHAPDLVRDNQLMHERLAEQDRAIEQLHAAVKTAQELAATRLMEIERLQKDLRRANSALVRHGVQTDPAMNTHPSDEPFEQQLQLPGPRVTSEDSVWQSAESSRPRELLAQQMEPDTSPLTHQEIFSAVHHHAAEIVKLTAAVPAQCTQGASRDTSPELHAKGCPCPDCLNGTTRSNVEQFASRDASPADLVGALQDVVHTDTGPVRAGKAHRDAFSEFVCPNHGRVQQLTDSGDCPMCYQDRHAQRT